MSFFALFIIVGWVVLPLLLTEKVLAKNGLLCTQFQRKTEPEQKFFPFAKLQKRAKEKWFLRINM
jgi:hypothetical protein